MENTKIATIGNRNLSFDAILLCNHIGFALAENDYTLVSGNADGADSAFVDGASKVLNHKVEIKLPWKSFNANKLKSTYVVGDVYPNEYAILAESLCPNWKSFTYPVKQLFIRNVAIVKETRFVLAMFANEENMSSKHGGTIFALKIANKYNIPYLKLNPNSNISISDILENIKNEII